MHTRQITFTRVFDVVRRESQSSTWTDFGFAWAQGRVFGARVPGHPPLRDGMTVKLVMREEGQWGTILGWRDLQTGQLHVVNGGSGSLGTTLIAIAVYLLFAPMLLPSLIEGPPTSSLAAGGALLLPGAMVAHLLHRRRQYALTVHLLQGA